MAHFLCFVSRLSFIGILVCFVLVFSDSEKRDQRGFRQVAQDEMRRDENSFEHLLLRCCGCWWRGLVVCAETFCKMKVQILFYETASLIMMAGMSLHLGCEWLHSDVMANDALLGEEEEEEAFLLLGASGANAVLKPFRMNLSFESVFFCFLVIGVIRCSAVPPN